MENLNLNIEKNPFTGGTWCEFTFKGQNYYADRSYVPYIGTKTMIFAKKNGIIDWEEELYTDRTYKSLSDCIHEFCRTL